MNSLRRATCFWDLAETHPVLFSVGWFPVFLLSVVWAWLARLKRALARAPYESKIPSLCVGNLTLGGSGKTPVVKALADHFKDLNPVIISRGYRGAAERRGDKVLLSDKHGARRYGDEPWMLAHQTGLPTYVGKDRRQSVKRAEREHAGLLLFDDGFQNPQVQYTQSLLLWDPDLGPRGRYCFPLGLLREPLSAKRRATHVLEASKSGETFKNEGPFNEREETPAHLENERLGAFCGVGNGGPFFAYLRGRFHLAHEESFADHYWYTPADIDRLNRVAEANGITGWIVTEKDWFRIGESRSRFSRPLYFTRLTAKLTQDVYKRLDGLRALT